MTRALISRADLLRILQRSDQEVLADLAGNLQYQRLAGPSTPRVEPLPGATKATAADAATAIRTHHWPAEMVDIPLWRAVAYQPRDRDQAVERPREVAARIQWRQPPADRPSYPLLTQWRDLLPRLRGGLAEAIRSSRLDIRTATDQIARGEVLSEMPRLPVRKWGTRVYVIADRSDYLIPFWHDQEFVIDRLQTIIPSYALEYVVAQNPNRMRLLSADGGYERFSEIPEDALLLVLGDLGLLKAHGQSLQNRWSTWVRQATDQGARIIILTPGSVEKVDPSIRAIASVVPWQPPRTDYVDDAGRRSSLVETILALAAPLVRLEPGLLRCLRLMLPGAEDGSLEADAWQHPALLFTHPVAATIDREFAESQLLDIFRSQPQWWPDALKTVRAWRGLRSKHPEIWFEEINGLDPAVRRAVPQTDVDDALSTAAYLRDRIKDAEGGGDRDVEDYLRRMSERMTEAAANHAMLGPIYREFYRATHPAETYDAIRGYDPKELPPGKTTTSVPVIHQGRQLRFAPPPAGASPLAPAPLANLRTTQASLVIRQPSFWKSGAAPAWADAWGWDEHGAYAEFSVRSDAAVGRPNVAIDTPPYAATQRMRWIPAGTFLMGSPETEKERYDDEGPQHQVTITQGYWIFDTAVTQQLWQAVMGQNPSHFQGLRRPVEQVSWDDCQQFLAKISGLLYDAPFSLPTEAQWEYACRAGTETPFALGENITPDEVNYDGNYPYADGVKGLYRRETVEVGSLPANAWGLFEMHGNVDEWCQDGMRQYREETVADPVGPTGPGADRVLRGGSWNYDAQFVRSAARNSHEPGERYGNVGFRCALVQGQAEPESSSPGREAEPRPDEKTRGGAARISVRIGENPICRLPNAPRLRILTDLDELELERFTKPPWATAIGRDRYGLWAQFKLRGEGTDEDVRQRMRWIPPGRFLMGSDDPKDSLIRGAKPQHEVVISNGFWLFETPVTQALWQAVMGVNRSKFPGPQRPVEMVSWHDCHAFIEKLADHIKALDLVLPTEAEWEYACRAGTQTAYSTGHQITQQEARFGGYAEKKERGTVDVASYEANPWGLYDMHGNVWEWCFDGPRRYASQTEVDPIGSTKKGAGRAVRGGSWSNGAQSVRSAYRDASVPGDRLSDLGFRCALVQAQARRSPSERSEGPGEATQERPGP